MTEVIGRYAKVPYWKCLTPENNHSMIKVKDIFAKQYGNYDFSNAKTSVEADTQTTQCNNTTLATMKAEANDEQGYSQDDPSRVKVDEGNEATDCIDNRDVNLIMGVAADYDYAEYIKMGTRSFVSRPDSSFSLSGDPESRPLSGRSQKMNAVLSLYRSNTPEFQSITDDSELSRLLINQFRNNDVLSNDDTVSSPEFYLALWANAPVRKGARWKLN